MILGASFILEKSVWGQQRPQRPTSVLAPRPGVPMPSALPSQRLAAQAPARTASSKRSCFLRSSRRNGSVDLVEMILEGNGKLHLAKNQGGGETRTELLAGFRYEERTENYDLSPQMSLRSVRQYSQAGMKQKLGNNVTRSLLDASRKNIITEFDGKKLNLYSPGGPLKGEQFLLLNDLSCNTLLLDLLLPNKQVSLGDEWIISSDILAALLNLEAVENNTLKFTLTAIIDDIAEIDFYLEGGKDEKGKDLPSTLEGAFYGASVGVNLEGKYQFDLKRNRMSWLGIKIAENRTESLVEPAADITAILRIKIASLSKPEQMTDDVVQDLLKTPADRRLVYDGQNGPWTFLYDRHWRMIEDTKTSSALCLVIKGEGIGQCNIYANPLVEREKMPPLDFYKKELKEGLGDRFGKFVRDSSFVNEIGYLVYAVIIDGNYEEQPYRWIYYLMTSPEGCQASIMFEVRADMLEKFNEIDEYLVDSFRMIIPESVQKQRAEEAEKAAEKEAAEKKTSRRASPLLNKPIDAIRAPEPKKDKEKAISSKEGEQKEGLSKTEQSKEGQSKEGQSKESASSSGESSKGSAENRPK